MMTGNDIGELEVDVSITELDIVADAFEEIGASLEDFADTIDDEDMKEQLSDIADAAYGLAEATQRT